MIDKTTRGAIVLAGVAIVYRVFAFQGIILPIDGPSNVSNKHVSVAVVLAGSDLSLPRYMPVCQSQKEFVVISNVVDTNVRVDGKIRIENNSKWEYGFGLQDCLTGYDCLELDLLLSDGTISVMKRRRPIYLSDNGLSIKLMPGRKWECPISLDKRLWEFYPELTTNKIIKIRPRFAFGAYYVDGKYFRTLEEVQARSRRIRKFDDRDGELVGSWIDYKVQK